VNSQLNKRLKRWPGWIVLLAVVIAALAIGSSRSGGPLTQDDRADGIAQRLACPTCDGESVYESQSPGANDIRKQIRRFIEQGQGDTDIISYFEQRNPEVLLVPKAKGFDSLVWMLPVFAFVCAVAGLAVAFRRWKSAVDTVPSEQDRLLVAQALSDDALNIDAQTVQSDA
jgi:cytochrome c-type biogenesis protein CcmH